MIGGPTTQRGSPAFVDHPPFMFYPGAGDLDPQVLAAVLATPAGQMLIGL